MQDNHLQHLLNSYTCSMKILRSALILLFTATSATAQSSVWEVTDGTNTIYLGGTCHILRQADYPLPAEFDVAYEAADELHFEVDPAELQAPEFAVRLMAESVYRDGRTLKSVLNAEAYSALEAQGKKSNIPIEVIQQSKPGMAIVMMTMQELTKIGVRQEGVDLYYHKKGITEGKPIGSLETADFQIKIISGMGEGMESEFVLYGLQDLDKIGEYFEKLIEAWRAGDVEAIERLFISDMKSFPDIYNELLKNRNLRWVPQIDQMLKTAPTEFILVGVAHMAGEDGVLTMLEEKGYTVRQLGN